MTLPYEDLQKSFGNLLLPERPSRERHPTERYIAALQSKSSRKTMRYTLHAMTKLLCKYLGTAVPANPTFYLDVAFWNLSSLQFQELVDLTGQTYQLSTARRGVAAAKGVFLHAYRLKLIDITQYTDLKLVENVRGDDAEPTGRFVEQDERKALLDACLQDTSPQGVRDAAIIALGFGCGPRCSEFGELILSDVSKDRRTLRILGKGRKVRKVPIPQEALPFLMRWLELRGDADEPLFCHFHWRSNQLLTLKSLSKSQIYSIIKQRVKEAGIKALTPHDLRRTFISLALEVTDLARVQKWAGHADPQTTARYDRRRDDLGYDKADEINFF